MCLTPRGISQKSLVTFLACCVALAPGGLARTDHDADGYDDVWQRVHGVTVAAFPLTGDADGDGNSNYTESEAGTDLRSPTSVLSIRTATQSAGNLVFGAATVNLKRYQLQSSGSPGGPTWVNEGAPVTGDGTVKNFTTPLSGTQKFYRIFVQDQDTDGDGVSDWAEARMGTNAGLATSPGNASGGAASDGDTLRSLLSITAAALTPTAFEKEGTPASVRFTRTFGTMPLTVPLAQGGAADPTKGSASPADFTLFTM